MMVYSASNIWAGYKFNDSLYYIKRQGIFAVIGIIAMFVFSKIDYHIYQKNANKLLIGSFYLDDFSFDSGDWSSSRGVALMV